MQKKLWSELTPAQQQEFIKQLIHIGDNDTANYPNHLYQIKDGKCHGWIVGAKNLKK